MHKLSELFNFFSSTSSVTLNKFIIYVSPSGNRRKITVVDGQPYYESTGENSNSAGVWFPFIMIRGTKDINFKNIPTIYNSKFFKLQYETLDEYHITKFEVGILQPSVIELPQMREGRIPTRETLITSCRLAGGTHQYYNLHAKAGLTESEIERANTPIKLEKNPESTLTNPNEINAWLVRQGAVVIQKLFDISPIKTTSQTSAKDGEGLLKVENLEQEKIYKDDIGLKPADLQKKSSDPIKFTFESHGFLQPKTLKESTQLQKKLEIIENDLVKLSPLEIYQYCERKKFDLHVCLKILSSHLDSKHDIFQSLLIKGGGPDLAIALYEKGDEFLFQLSTSALFEICELTAKNIPEISIHMLSTPKLLLNKLDDNFLGLLFYSNPNIEKAIKPKIFVI